MKELRWRLTSLYLRAQRICSCANIFPCVFGFLCIWIYVEVGASFDWILSAKNIVFWLWHSDENCTMLIHEFIFKQYFSLLLLLLLFFNCLSVLAFNSIPTWYQMRLHRHKAEKYTPRTRIWETTQYIKLWMIQFQLHEERLQQTDLLHIFFLFITWNFYSNLYI